MVLSRLVRFISAILLCVVLAACNGQPQQFNRAIKTILSGDAQSGFQQLDYLAQSGYGPAQLRVGVMYGDGQLVRADVGKAVYWIITAARRGDFAAAYFLANLYETGKWLPQDLNEALVWYQQAAESGLVPAQYRTALFYEAGYGADSDDGAVHWMQTAAGNRHKQAMLTMAEWYEQGRHGLPKDTALAAQWRSSAAPKVLWGGN